MYTSVHHYIQPRNIMNCKPNDLAIVVGIDAGAASNSQPNEYGLNAFKMIAVDIRGTIVKCISPHVIDGEVQWDIEPREIRYKGIMNDGRTVTATGTLTSAPDRILRPLRGGDLGEDVFSEEPIDSDVLLEHNTIT